MPLRTQLRLLAAAALIVLGVFLLWLRHAEQLCLEQGARWAEGECHFDERRPEHAVPLGRVPFPASGAGPDGSAEGAMHPGTPRRP